MSAESSQNELLSEEQWNTKFSVVKILDPIETSAENKLKLIRSLIPSNPSLNREQRNLFLSTYRGVTLSKRNGLRMLRAIAEQQRQRGRIERAQKLDELKSILQMELFDICSEVQMMIDKYLLPEANDAVSNAFYLRTKADFYRYEFEFATDSNRPEISLKAKENYTKARQIEKESIPKGSALSLSIALNFSVFLYECENQKKLAIDAAQQALDDSGILVNDGNDEDFTEATTLQHLLRDNVTMWTRDEGEA